VRGRGPAAAADQVHPALVEEALELEGETGRRLAVLAALVGQAGVGIDAHEGRRQSGEERVSVMNSGPVAQFSPTEQGARCSSDTHSASTPWPASIVRGRLDRRAHHQQRRGRPLPGIGHAESGGLDVQRVLAGLEQQRVHPTGDEPGRLHQVPRRTSSNVTFRVTVIVRVDGPMAPITSASPTASRASWAAAREISTRGRPGRTRRST
jgi:hypothetical protein